jgi:hypothetical protein
MKVVLFCGGQGMRSHEYSDKVPKPMAPNRVLADVLMKIKEVLGQL